MRARRCLSCALIAGLSYREAMAAAPGMIFDLFFMKRRYDDVLHGVRRKRESQWGDE